jgi:hypothetical protein
MDSEYKSSWDSNGKCTVHDDRMVDAPTSKGAHEKTKPLAVMDYNKYKVSVDRLDQLLAYY